MNCGTGLKAEASAGFRLDRYIPHELLSKLESVRTRGATAGERRVITILFCDVKGSTAAAERLDPEDWTEIMNGAFEQMIPPIYRYEGMVPRLMGDAILAFFGAPIAHEDDPQRAILAALDIQANMETYSRRILEAHGIDVKLRVGINTGLVVVGEVGSDLRLEYTAIGDAINVAARMEQTAEPGTIQVSDATYKLVAPFFEFESLGESQIKGKSHLIRTFRVIGTKGTPRQLRGVDGLSSPLVGREAELLLLEACWHDLRKGQGAFVAVTGEAGLGKTTLVAETRRRIPDPDHGNWLEGHALSYTGSISYFAWRQVIRQAIGAEERDAPPSARLKLRAAAARWSVPEADIAFLEAVLGVESDESSKIIANYVGDALVQHITHAMDRYFTALAREAPLVIVLDDLHWMDAASLDLLENLMDMVRENAIMLIGTSRPEQDAAGWKLLARAAERLGERFHRVSLEPLSTDRTNQLLSNLLGMENPPREFRELVLSKAEGNPFFIEEIIRSLIDAQQIIRENSHWRIAEEVHAISLPGTLTGLLGARIDHLPDETKYVLQVASVIGRSFDRPLLGALTGFNGRCASHIKYLEQAGLIQQIQIHEEQYEFRHALVHDAAYGSLLLKQRRSLHQAVGTALEQKYAGRAEEFASLLAHHFYLAEDARSVHYDALAGDAAARLFANTEAIIHYGRALEIAGKSNAETSQIQQLHSKLGGALELAGRYEEALETYDAMSAFGTGRESRVVEIAALMAKATIYSIFTRMHNSELSEKLLLRALELSREIGDSATECKLHWNLMLTYLFSKRPDLSLQHGTVALDLARHSDDREQLAFVLNDLCRLYTCRGEFEKAVRVVSEARGLWESLDNQVMLADSLGSEAEARFNGGEFQKAYQCAKQALQITERIENGWGQSYDRMLLSFVDLEQGMMGRGIQLANESIHFADEAGLIASSIGLRSELAWVYAYCGALEKGLPLIEQALEVAEQKQPAWKAFPQAARIRMYLIADDLRSAQEFAGSTLFEPISIPYARYTIFLCLANIELAVKKGDYRRAIVLAEDLLKEVVPLTRPDIPDVLRWKAEALLGLGQTKEACQTLRQASSLAEGLGADSQLWLILATLARARSALGHGEEAQADLHQAQGIIGSIAENLRNVGLSDSFLGRPAIRALMREVR